MDTYIVYNHGKAGSYNPDDEIQATVHKTKVKKGDKIYLYSLLSNKTLAKFQEYQKTGGFGREMEENHFQAPCCCPM